MFTWPGNRNIVSILNTTALLYLSGVAAAIGFRMNLFNIGVEGQYRIAAFAAGRVRRSRPGCPGDLNTAAADRGRDGRRRPVGRHRRHPAGHARGQRGHLDDHAERDRGSLVAYFLAEGRREHRQRHATPRRSRRVPGSARSRCSATAPPSSTGCRCSPSSWASRFWVLLNRTRFGFDLRAIGQSRRRAAVASGVNVQADDRRRDAALRCRRRADRPADDVLRLARLRVRVPDGPRLHRHRGGAAGPQQPGRDRLRRADLRVPDRAGHPARTSWPASRPTSSPSPRASSCWRS